MKKSYVVFIFIIMVLSLFTYFQERDLTKIKAENETLKSELYDLENDLVAVNSKLKDKEEAFDALKDHPSSELANALQKRDQPCTASEDAWLARRKKESQTRTEGTGRCGTVGHAQCR